ncbi:hypothetical protein EJB05_41881, partial [Eragrostis curvula]
RGPCATHGTGRRGHSTPRGHEGAGSTRRGLYLRASAGPAVELLGSAELWVVQELAGATGAGSCWAGGATGADCCGTGGSTTTGWSSLAGTKLTTPWSSSSSISSMY